MKKNCASSWLFTKIINFALCASMFTDEFIPKNTPFSRILPQVSTPIFHTQYPYFASMPCFEYITSVNTVLTHIILQCLVTPDEFQFPLRIDRLLPSIVLVSVRVSRDCHLSARHDIQIHSAI